MTGVHPVSAESNQSVESEPQVKRQKHDQTVSTMLGRETTLLRTAAEEILTYPPSQTGTTDEEVKDVHKLNSSNFRVFPAQGLTRDAKGQFLSKSSSETKSSDSVSSSTRRRTVHRDAPGSGGLRKEQAGNQLLSRGSEKDTLLNLNALKSALASGTSSRLPLSSSRSNAGAYTKGGIVQLTDKGGGKSIGKGTASEPLNHDSNFGALEPRWAEQLLLDCAVAISSENFARTQHLMWVLNDLGNLAGDANQRLAAHGLKALFFKVCGTSQLSGVNPMVSQAEAGTKVIHKALLKFHDVNPWHQMVYTVANSVMQDSFEKEDKIHVIDIGVSQGTQWPTFIEALATRASGPPSLLRLTVVKEEDGGKSSSDLMGRLERFAKLVGINIELNTVISPLEELTEQRLFIKDGEALAVCTQFRLHKLPEELVKQAVTSFSPRDTFLRFLHSLKPRVLILSENDVDHLSSDFLTRFQPVVDYFWKFLDSISFSFHGKQCEERQIIEFEAAMKLINNIACEGEQRKERNESHGSWTKRMKSSGFLPVLPKEEILDTIRVLIRKYDANWEYVVDDNCVVLLWKQQPATFCSVWKPS